MKKSLLIRLLSALLIIIFIFSLCSCEIKDDYGDENGKLTMKKEEEIKEAYFSKQASMDRYISSFQLTVNDLKIVNYYGKYNNCYIVIISGKSNLHYSAQTIETVGDVDINYTDTNRILAYVGGKFFSLQTAYKQRRLTKDDLFKIAENHNANYKYKDKKLDFADDYILIVLNTETSFKALDKRLTLDDFKISNANSLYCATERYYSSPPPHNQEFHMMYILFITNKGKENIIDAIKQLEKLDFIESAEPDYAGYYGVDQISRLFE